MQLEVDGQPFYIDLLFYHLRLHCYFVIELKNGAFKPEYAGKLSFYLSAVDGIMRTAVDGPSIGVLLCESRSGPIVEYTLQNIVQPIGISTYRVTRELPEPLQAEVPSIEDLQEVVETLRKELTRPARHKRRMWRSHDRGARHEHCPGPAGATGRGAGRPHCWRRGAEADGADDVASDHSKRNYAKGLMRSLHVASCASSRSFQWTRYFCRCRSSSGRRRGLSGFANTDLVSERFWAHGPESQEERGLLLSYVIGENAAKLDTRDVHGRVQQTIADAEIVFPGAREQFEAVRVKSWSEDPWHRGGLRRLVLAN